MMNKTEAELRDVIRQLCKQIGRESVGKKLKVTPQYISMLLRRDNPRSISDAVAGLLGYTRETAKTVVFVPKNNSHKQLTRKTKSVTL